MKKELLILKRYSEGEISTSEFWNFYKSSPKIQKMLIKDKFIGKNSYYTPGIIEKHFNIDDIFERFGLYEVIRAYFIRQKKQYNFFNEDEEFINLINKIQPRYVDIRNQAFWDKIISSVPQELKKSERIKLLKDKVKNLFPYESKPPRWIQSPEWVIENGTPLKFIKQINKFDRSEYYFYNQITKQTKMIEQFD